MKKNNFKFYCLSVIIFTALIYLVLLLLGFKFIYSPKLNNNWEAIASVGTWFTGCISATITIYIFYRQNKFESRISEREERIALFDKRYAVYSQAKAWVNNAKTVNTNLPGINIDLFLAINFSGLDKSVVLPIITNKAKEIEMAKFCYPKEIYELLIKMSELYSSLIFELTANPNSDTVKNMKKNLTGICNQINSLHIFEQMEKVLIISNESLK